MAILWLGILDARDAQQYARRKKTRQARAGGFFIHFRIAAA
ncbi:MAG TPA: hypothetical protein VJ752_00460 [Burkholderiaceae bacterium]|nr:hypothetical protein [Burkholderiaceae bacterium]